MSGSAWRILTTRANDDFEPPSRNSQAFSILNQFSRTINPRL